MDFSEAIHGHIAWLEDIIDQMNRPASLDPDEVRQDDLCAIGQWLRGLEPRYGELPEYTDLTVIHTELHKLAGDAIVLAQAGKLEQAERYLSEEGECVEKSKLLLKFANRFLKRIDKL